MYKVINTFKEDQHGGHVYRQGEPYPAKGKKLVKSRAEFLTKVHPEYNVAFLEEVKEKEPEPNKQDKDKKSDA